MNNPAGLTARETEVVRMMAEDRTAKFIAKELGIAVKTVEFHSVNAKRKVHGSTAMLTHYAIATGLVSPKVWAVLFVMLISINSFAPQSPKALSQKSGNKMVNAMPSLVVVPRKTNGITSLAWDGSPTNTTIINQTAGNAYLVATNQTITIGGLPTTPQTFIATNKFGASNPLVVVPPPNTNRFVLFVDRLALDNIGNAGILQSSSNNVIWVDEGPISANSRVYISPTNASRFYRGRY